MYTLPPRLATSTQPVEVDVEEKETTADTEIEYEKC
jgi:hypothetical protein